VADHAGVTGKTTENFPPSVVDALADRVAERILERVEGATSPWLSAAKAAAYLDWPRERLYKLTAAGEIPHYKHAGRILFRRDELDQWLANYQQGYEPPLHIRRRAI
jgi:excisionase family DNA binding protein